MIMLPNKKLHIDSRFKTSSSEAHSNSTVDLPVTLLMPEDTRFYIEDVCIPHTWYPVNTRNNSLQSKYCGCTPEEIEIEPGSYSVSDQNAAIVAKINAVCIQGEICMMGFGTKTNTIGVKNKTATPGTTFKIYTDSKFTDPTTKSGA